MTRSEKLVRDKIPEIIGANGEECEFRTASSAEMHGLLRAKLQEEVAEYIASGEPGELADILEVVYALGAVGGIAPFELDDLRNKKARTRGRFHKGIVLAIMSS